MKMQPTLIAAALGSLGLLGACVAVAEHGGTPPLYSQIVRGRYLVEAGDCAACHTQDGGKPFAGGRGVPTPFGTIYASNITPDGDTGIGKWSEDDFWKALHDGVDREGNHLYPAFPYPWYTKLGHDDVLAIKAYLDTLPPVRNEVKKPDLPWPISWRGSLAVWNGMFFKPGVYQSNPQKSREWNRGAYLVEGAGHCGACHSPKNFLGGVKHDEQFQGGMGEGWFATSIRPNPGDGLAAWSVDDIATYLKTGRNERTQAMGPMAEVVEHSTSHLNDDDLHAIGVYLKDLPGRNEQRKTQQASTDSDALRRGRLVYVDQCEGCHMENGTGLGHVFPPLQGNTAVHAENPTSLARIVLEGAHDAKTSHSPDSFAMPSFADKLTDSEIADVLTYIRGNFGNQAGAVAASKVADVRKAVTEGN